MSGCSNTETVARVAAMMREKDTRLVTIVAADDGEGTAELIYIMDRRGELIKLRVRCRWDEELESLSPEYKGAENMEREMIDLLGLSFQGVQGGLFLGPGGQPPLRTQGE
jgi:NADH:ubiquinone oxidoreductase subunit C